MRLLVGLSALLYRVALLRRYPRALRRRYGAAMVGLFKADLEDRTRARGLLGLAAGWGRMLRDWLRPLPSTPTTVAERDNGDRDRGTRGGEAMKGIGRGLVEDVGFAWRALRREPSFTGAVVAVLGAGVALNAAVFAVVDAYLVRPLPYPDADRVVTVRSPVAVTWDDAEGVLEKRVSWDLDVFTIVGDGKPQMARGAWVTPDFLEVYGVTPALGRSFAPDERGPGAASVVMIGYGLWQDRYAGDPDVLGRTFSAFTSDRPDDAETFTIVGVLPADFWHFNDYTEVLAPLRADRQIYAGRLAEGTPLASAERTIEERMAARLPVLPEGPLVELRRAQDDFTESVRSTLLTLESAVLLVFLIACANGAVLLLVRSARRERELGVRRALGAARGRLVRQLAAEGAILAGLAGATGLALAGLLLEAVRGVSSLTLWRMLPGGVDSLHLGGTVVATTVGLCALVAVVFGFVPLALSSARDLGGSLAEGVRAGTDTRVRRRVRNVMVGAELALSLALLVGAGLMVRSAINLQSLDLGFDPRGVLRGQMGLRQSSYAEPERRVAFFDDAVARMRSVPGVVEAGLVSAAPFTWRYSARAIETDDGSSGEGVVQLADGQYFEAMDIDLLRGRAFGPLDAWGGEEVAIVSETLAEELWPGSDPLGRRLRVMPVDMEGMPAEPGPWATVVGLVRDVRKGVDGTSAGDLYRSYRQAAPFWMNAVIRQREGAPVRVSAIEEVLADLDPEVPFATVGELSDAVAGAMAPSRFLATLFGGFAALATVLAVVGLYGVMAYAARQRRRDMAIRMALGADVGDVRRLFLRQALAVLVGGLVAGVVGGRLLGAGLAGEVRGLASQLHGVEPGDPTTFVTVLALLGGTALVAVWMPAKRAGEVRPMAVLRED